MEISLTISISNCRFRCHGCHSPYLQRDIGKPLQPDIDALIRRYDGQITCVCLMGEGRNMTQLEKALVIIRTYGLKTCQYSGCDRVKPFERQLPLLDYIKLGPYRADLGGLDSPATNQRFYSNNSGKLIDQTRLFQRSIS